MSSMPMELLFSASSASAFTSSFTKGTGDEPAEFVTAVIIEFIFEKHIPPIWQESVHPPRENGFPCHAGDTEIDSLAVVILTCPPGKLSVVGGSAPFSGIGIEPEKQRFRHVRRQKVAASQLGAMAYTSPLPCVAIFSSSAMVEVRSLVGATV